MSDVKLTTVATFPTRIDAEIARGALRAAGIESIVSADDAGGVRPTPWIGGVQLRVRSEDAQKATRILRAGKRE